MKKILIISLLLLGIAWAQEPKARTGTFALTNATLVTVTNGTIENGTLLIQDGKIAAIGEEVDVPADAEVINCEGKFVYPGLIDGGNHLGLYEVGSISLTQDYREVGDVTPQAKALTAINPNSAIIPTTRNNGVTTGLAKPEGGLFPGTAALVNYHGYTPEQMSTGFEAVTMNFPSGARRGRWDRRSDEDIEKARKKALKELDEVWEKLAQYHRRDSLAALGKAEPNPFYPEMEALLPAYRNESPLLIEVDASADIETAIKWVSEHNVDAIFTGVSEGWRAADAIAEAGIPVITGPVMGAPTREYDRYDRPYANAGLMHAAGVKVAIRTNGEGSNRFSRNLPFDAGFAAAYGLGKEEALRAVTIVPAEIFGMDDQLGSLEEGKIANLMITDGDPFETRTQISHVFIKGYLMPNSDRQIRLYDEFLERDPGAGE